MSVDCVVVNKGAQKRIASSILAVEAQLTNAIGCETLETSVDSPS